MNKTYWYRFFWGACPVCGREQSYKERVYNEEKPTDWNERHFTLSDFETYDYCMN